MSIKNWKDFKTTSIGVVLISFSIISVFVKSTTWTDAMYGIVAGILLILAPDKLIDNFKDLLKILVIVFFASCTSEQKLAKVCADKYPIKDSTIVIERIDTTFIEIKGDTIKVPFKVKDSSFFVSVPCPSVKVPSVQKSSKKVVYLENTAKTKLSEIQINALAKQNMALVVEIQEMQKKINDQKETISTLRRFKIRIYILFISLIAIYLIKIKLW